MKRKRIGIDIMGGDFSPKATVEGAVLAKKELSANTDVCLIGDKKIIVSILKSLNELVEDFNIFDAPEVIEMGDHPTRSFLQKPNSSISIGFKLLKKGEIDGFASAGNTGAMVVGGHMSLKPIPGIIRPPLCSILPKENGGVNIILDVGANADCKTDILYQFGIIGTLFAKYVCEIKDPKVGLLNIGEEDSKGNILSVAAHKMMKDSIDFNFVGNIESRDLFSNIADVIVCDGFTGNIVVKEVEAFYSILKRRGVEDDFIDRFNYEDYGGTPLIGLNKPVIIGHGISNAIAIKNMISLTCDIVESDLSSKIYKKFNND